MRLLWYLKFTRWLYAALCIPRLCLKGVSMQLSWIVFQAFTVAPCGCMLLHAAPCISGPNLKNLHTVPVVFEVYTVAPCGSMRLHASLDLI